MAANFHTEKGEATIADAASTVTITEGTDYNLPAGATALNTFLLPLPNTHLSGRHDGASQDIRDITAWCNNPGNVLASLTFERYGSSGVLNVRWLILTYTGKGASTEGFEVKAVGTGELLLTDGADKLPGLVGANAGYAANCIVFLVGQGSDLAGRTGLHEGLHTTKLTDEGSGRYDVQVRRGAFGTQESKFSYALVHFGAYWRPVQRILATNDDLRDPTLVYGAGAGNAPVWSPGSPNLHGILDITDTPFGSSGRGADPVNPGGGSFTSFKDLSRVIAHVQFRSGASGNQGLNDVGCTSEPDSENLAAAADASHGVTDKDILVQRRRSLNDAAQKVSVTWILEWDPPAGVAEHELLVWNTHRFFGNVEVDDDSADELDLWMPFNPSASVQIPAALVAGTAVFAGGGSSDGAGTAFPLSFTDYSVTGVGAASNLNTLRAALTGNHQEERQAISVVVQWPLVPQDRGGFRGGAASIGALHGGAASLPARGGASRTGAKQGGAAGISARGGDTGIGAVQGGAR